MEICLSFGHVLAYLKILFFNRTEMLQHFITVIYAQVGIHVVSIVDAGDAEVLKMANKYSE